MTKSNEHQVCRPENGGQSGGVRWRLLVVALLLLAAFLVWRRATVSATDDGWAALGELPEEVWGGAAVANPRFILEFGRSLAELWSDQIEFGLRDDLLEMIGMDVLSVEDWRRAGFDPDAPIWFAAPVLDASGDSLAMVVSVGVVEPELALASMRSLVEGEEFDWLTIREAGHEIYTDEEEVAFLFHGQRMYLSGGDDRETALKALRKFVDETAARLAGNADFRMVRGGLPRSNFAAYLPLSRLVRVLRHEDFHLSAEELVWLDWFDSNFRAAGLVADRGYGRLLLAFAEGSELRDRLWPADSPQVFTGRFGEPLLAVNVSLDRPVPLLFDLVEQLGGAEALAEFEDELKEELRTDRDQLGTVFEQLTGGLLFYGFKGFFEPEFVVFLKIPEGGQATVDEWIRRIGSDLEPRRYGNNLLYREGCGDSLVGFVDGYLVFGNATRHMANVAEGRYANWQPRGGDALLSLELRVARILAETGEMLPPQTVDAITLLFGRERDRQYIHAELTRTDQGLVLNAETPVLRVLFGEKLR